MTQFCNINPILIIALYPLISFRTCLLASFCYHLNPLWLFWVLKNSHLVSKGGHQEGGKEAGGVLGDGIES